MRILFVGRTRYPWPLDRTTKKKFDALARVSDVRVLASTDDPDAPHDDQFHLVPPARPRLLDGLLFHVSLPLRVARELRDFEPDSVLVHGPHDAVGVLIGRRLAGSDARVVVELHGDWRTNARLYGSPLRRLVAPFVDALTRVGI